MEDMYTTGLLYQHCKKGSRDNDIKNKYEKTEEEEEEEEEEPTDEFDDEGFLIAKSKPKPKEKTKEEIEYDPIDSYEEDVAVAAEDAKVARDDDDDVLMVDGSGGLFLVGAKEWQKGQKSVVRRRRSVGI